jgi:hypothetical protein
MIFSHNDSKFNHSIENNSGIRGDNYDHNQYDYISIYHNCY